MICLDKDIRSGQAVNAGKRMHGEGMLQYPSGEDSSPESRCSECTKT
jgi:hypothetical protein